MATATRPQPISGVSAGKEAHVDTVYPSITANGLGRLVGSILDSIPTRINGIKLSQLLFGLPLAPLGLTAYALLKMFGHKYVLTNRSLKVHAALGVRLDKQISLSDIDNIDIVVLPGQAAFASGNLEVLNDRGDPILVLEGVPRPERFRQEILECRDARRLSDASLKMIEARAS
jgi:hypothetical protein